MFNFKGKTKSQSLTQPQLAQLASSHTHRQSKCVWETVDISVHSTVLSVGLHLLWLRPTPMPAGSAYKHVE